LTCSFRPEQSKASSEALAKRLPDQQPGKVKPTLAWVTAKVVEGLLNEGGAWTGGHLGLLAEVRKRMTRKPTMHTLESALIILRQYGIEF
jgi:hypothetical protein